MQHTKCLHCGGNVPKTKYCILCVEKMDRSYPDQLISTTKDRG